MAKMIDANTSGYTSPKDSNRMILNLFMSAISPHRLNTGMRMVHKFAANDLTIGFLCFKCSNIVLEIGATYGFILVSKDLAVLPKAVYTIFSPSVWSWKAISKASSSLASNLSSTSFVPSFFTTRLTACAAIVRKGSDSSLSGGKSFSKVKAEPSFSASKTVVNTTILLSCLSSAVLRIQNCLKNSGASSSLKYFDVTPSVTEHFCITNKTVFFISSFGELNSLLTILITSSV